MDFQEVGWGEWTGLIWLRIGTDEGHLYTPKCTFVLYKMLGVS